MEKRGSAPSRWTLFFLLMSSSFIMIGGAIVAPALPAISEAFPDAPQTMVSMIVTMPGLAISMTCFISGWLADRFGKVGVLAISTLVVSIGGSAGYFLDSLPIIILSRFILGIGIGGITVMTTALISEYYTGDDRIRVIGYQSAAMGAGIMFLEASGGLASCIGWREPFLIYMIAFVFFTGIVLTMREPTAGIMKTGDSKKWEHGDTRIVVLCYSAAFIGLLIGFILLTNLPYHITELGSTALVSGILIGWFGICEAISSLMYKKISGIFDGHAILALSFTLAGIGYCVMFIPGSLIMIVLGLTLIGLGCGLINPTAVSWLSTVVTNKTSGKIMGGYSMVMNLATITASIISAPLLSIAVQSYGTLFLIMGAMLLVFGILCAIPTLILKMGDPTV